MSISQDKKIGNIGEDKVAKLFTNAGYKVEKNKTNSLIDFDLLVIPPNKKNKSFTIEVKYDKYSKKSGNIAIEYYNTSLCKPSGIYATKANLWAVVTPHLGIWITSVIKLKEYLEQNPPLFNVCGGGDGNASFFLYNAQEIFDKIFIRCDNISSKSLRKLCKKKD